MTKIYPKILVHKYIDKVSIIILKVRERKEDGSYSSMSRREPDGPASSSPLL